MTQPPSALPVNQDRPRQRGPALPNVLALLTYDDGPYDPEGDSWRLTFAVLTALVFAAILDREPLSPAARTFLLVVFGPELFRRMWVTLPQPLT